MRYAVNAIVGDDPEVLVQPRASEHEAAYDSTPVAAASWDPQRDDRDAVVARLGYERVTAWRDLPYGSAADALARH